MKRTVSASAVFPIAGLLLFTGVGAFGQAGAIGVNGTIPLPHKDFLGNNRPSGMKSLTPSGRSFVESAYRDGEAEVRMGRLALQRSQSPVVTAFAQRMVDDHSKADKELQHMARDYGITLQAEPTADESAMYNRLSEMRGAAFNMAYARAMVQDHTQAVITFRKFANSGHNSDPRTFAGDTLPTLRTHLQLAKDMLAAVSRGE